MHDSIMDDYVRLRGADVHVLAQNAVKAVAALVENQVMGGRDVIAPRVNSGAIWEQLVSLCWPAVVVERREPCIERRSCAGQIVIVGVGRKIRVGIVTN